nr:prostaglandin E2 receptor EP4 subtype-like [Procambarus clarkii]
MDGCVAMTDTILTVTCEGNVSCTDLPYQPGATIVSPIILSLSGVVGQIWALYYLYTSTRPQHSRTVFFLLLSTLIWTDLAGKIITTTPALVAYLHHTWAGGVPMCNLHGFSMMLVSLVTHLLVSTMAVERFLGIRHGYFYNKNITTSRTKLVLLCMWVFSVVFCALPLFGVGQYALQYPGSWCYVNIHVTAADPLLHRLYTNLFGAFTLLSLLVMVTCNVVVITTLLCLRLCRGGCCNHSRCAPHRSSRQRELEMQMVVVLVVITVVFVLSWTPIDVRLFVNQVWPHTTREDHYQDLVAVRLTSFNQIVDPWVYIICRKVRLSLYVRPDTLEGHIQLNFRTLGRNAPEVTFMGRNAPEVTFMGRNAPEVTFMGRNAPEITFMERNAPEVTYSVVCG